MKTPLSQILSVPLAASVLGEAVVRRIVRSALKFRQPNRELDPKEENLLVESLFYVPKFSDEVIPIDIKAAWMRFSHRAVALEKASFFKWLVPACAVPHPGAGGHMGLFDCLVHALTASSPSSSSSGIQTATLVLIPDVIIFLAVCQQYVDLQTMPLDQLDEKKRDHIISEMSILAFRIYNSYQKKGTVARDTVHRFLSDVYGEESYKMPTTRKLLDELFRPVEKDDLPKSAAVPSLTGTQFCKAVLETMTFDPSVSHLLLDWISALGTAMMPLEDLPSSTQAYLDTISSSHRSVNRICTQFGLGEPRLYEVKRRFHSLVESSNIIHGDPMQDEPDETNNNNRPKHVITQDAFVRAASLSCDELGFGGYLPDRLAKAVFQAGCPCAEQGQGNGYWALYDVLNFGFQAVRISAEKLQLDQTEEDPNLPLLRFAYRVFCSINSEAEPTTTKDDDRWIMKRNQIGLMLLLLLEHAAFRRNSDAPGDDEETLRETALFYMELGVEDMLVDVAASSLIGLLPPKISSDKIASDKKGVNRTTHVELRVLIDFVLEEGHAESDFLTFETFCNWHYNNEVVDLPISQRRLGPLLLDLRLVASVLFGIPPSSATLEALLIEEIQHRHKYRYPQTDVSRRGPRGTVWYIIEVGWYKLWWAHVQRVSGTDEDHSDGRDMASTETPRRLGKINNTSLLAENGSLALRANIRWRHDYEVRNTLLVYNSLLRSVSNACRFRSFPHLPGLRCKHGMTGAHLYTGQLFLTSPPQGLPLLTVGHRESVPKMKLSFTLSL
jgi:hypothetical protein